jgi:hypothetical protein
LHKSNEYEKQIDCPIGIFEAPVGNRCNITTALYIKRWVTNNYVLSTAIGGDKRR